MYKKVQVQVILVKRLKRNKIEFLFLGISKKITSIKILYNLTHKKVNTLRGVCNNEDNRFLKRDCNLSQGLILGIKPSTTPTINAKTGLIIDKSSTLAPK